MELIGVIVNKKSNNTSTGDLFNVLTIDVKNNSKLSKFNTIRRTICIPSKNENLNSTFKTLNNGDCIYVVGMPVAKCYQAQNGEYKAVINVYANLINVISNDGTISNTTTQEINDKLDENPWELDI